MPKSTKGTNRKGCPIDCNPPKSGEPTKCTKSDGWNECWCGTCGRWGSHDDDHHAGWVEKMKKRRESRDKSKSDSDKKDDSKKEADKESTAPSMHKTAAVCRPILSVFRGPHDSDTSF